MNKIADAFLNVADVLFEHSIAPAILSLPILVPMVIFFPKDGTSNPFIYIPLFVGCMLSAFIFGKWMVRLIFK